MKPDIPVICQRPYFPVLVGVPCNFWLFPKLKILLKGSFFESRKEIMRKRFSLFPCDFWLCSKLKTPEQERDNEEQLQIFCMKPDISVICQRPYFPILVVVPCNFWLFPKLKTSLEGFCFASREDIIRNRSKLSGWNMTFQSFASLPTHMPLLVVP